MPRFHPRYSYRILYAGNDLALLQYLQDTLTDCQVVRCPNRAQARLFIEKLNHSLLLFDEVLPDATGAELERFTHSLIKRGHTPVIIIQGADKFDLLARAINDEIFKEQEID